MKIRWIVPAVGLVALGMLIAALLLRGIVSQPAPISEAAVAPVAATVSAPAAAPAPSVPAAPEADETVAPVAMITAEDTARTVIIDEIRGLLPKRLDPVTTFADASYGAGRAKFTFLFRFLKIEVDPARVAAVIKPSVLKSFCADAYVTRLFAAGAPVDTEFRSADGFVLFAQTLDKQTCAGTGS